MTPYWVCSEGKPKLKKLNCSSTSSRTTAITKLTSFRRHKESKSATRDQSRLGVDMRYASRSTMTEESGSKIEEQET